MSWVPDHLTLAFTLAVIAAIIVYDVWTLVRRGYTTTISWNLYQASIRFPIIPFALGVVVGHIFWTNKAGEINGTPKAQTPCQTIDQSR